MFGVKERRNFAVGKPIDCQILVSIIIIANLSFWINKPFLPSLTEALDQYKQKGYVQKLKTDITPDFMHSGYQDLVTLLHRQVTHIDGRYFVYPRTTYEQFMADNAVRLEVEVMNTTKTKLGSANHPNILTTLASTLYRYQGRWDEAEKLEMDVMNARKTKLGLNHPSILISMANLASAYRNQGRWDEAEKLKTEDVTHVDAAGTTRAENVVDHPGIFGGTEPETQGTNHQRMEMIVCDSLLAAANCHKRHIQVKLAVQNMPKTKEWLLSKSEYCKWKAGTSPSHLLWLTGLPGSGKTVLSSLVIDDLRASKPPLNAVTYLYCQSLEGINCDSKTLLSTILGQLLLQLPQGEHSIVDLLVKSYGKLQQLADLQGLIMDISHEYEKVFIIVDAVDECEDHGNLLKNLLDKFGMHIFITSSRQRSVQDALPKTFNQVTISPMNIATDICQCIRTRVKRLSVRNPRFASNVIDGLTYGAQGSFLSPIYHMQQLHKMQTKEQIRMSLDSPPQGMNAPFLRALELMSQDHSWERLKHILHIALCSVRPMSIPELAGAVGMMEKRDLLEGSNPLYIQDIDELVDSCSRLLLRVPADNQNQLDFLIPVHSSLKDILLDHALGLTEDLAKYGFCPSSLVHDDLARLCLTCLRYKLAEHPFTKYAVTGCLDHIRASKTGGLTTDFRAFFSPGSVTFRGWCHLYKRQLGKFAMSGVGRHLERLDCAHLAVWFNLPTMLRHFSESELMTEDYRGLNTLHVAVAISASIDVIDCLLDKVDVNSLSRSGDTALHIAISESANAATTIQRLLESRPNVNAKDGEGRTPLHLLMLHPGRALSCIDMLLCSGADINAEDNSSRAPLHLASAAPEYVQKRRYSCLSWQESIAEGYSKVMCILLNSGADIELRDEANNTPLHIAAENANAFAVELLLQKGASIKARNGHGCMPIHLAVEHITPDSSSIRFSSRENDDHVLTIRHLINYGSDVNATDQHNRTPLHLAAHSACELKIFGALIQNNAIVTATDDSNISPLHLAVKMAPILNLNDPESRWRISWVGCRQIIEFLILSGADTHMMHDIAEKVCKFLQNSYPDIVTPTLDEPDHIYGSGSDLPSTAWLKGVTELLCSKGATVNLKTNQDYNPLCFAMESWASWIFEYHWMLATRQKADDMSVMGTYLAWLNIAKILH